MNTARSSSVLACLIAILTAGCAGLVGQSGGSLSINPTAINFKDVTVSSTGASQSLALLNSGSEPLTVTSASSTAPQFTLAGLTLPVTLQPSEKRTMQASFSPAAAEAYSGTLSFEYRLSGGGGTAQVAVSGEGTTAPPSSKTVTTPPDINYGNLNVGSISSSSFTVTNAGSATITISSFSSSSAAFQVTGPTMPLSVPPYNSAPFTVVFQPTAAGPVNATITVNSSASDSPSQVGVSGVGISTSVAPPALPAQPTAPASNAVTTPPNINYGNLNVGSISSSTFTVTNAGSAAMTISSFSSSSAVFQVAGPAMPLSVASYNSATFTVVFKPTAAGPASATITVNSSASDSPSQVGVSGVGVSPSAPPVPPAPPTQPTVPGLNPSVTSLPFGNVTVGSSSVSPVTFSNTGSSNITISGSTVSGAGFSTTGIVAGQVVAPGQAATMNVSFAPAATGPVSGSVTVASDASNATVAVAFSGTGTSAAAPPVVGAPTCGKSGDTSIEMPNDWASFAPPAKGQSYVDSSFGCTVTRITDSSSEDWNGSSYLPISHGYATVSPFNANDTYLMLADGWNRHFVTDLLGNIVVPIASMPPANDTWMLWDASNPNIFYYTNGNSLMQGTISGSSATSSTIHQFAEYLMVNFMDETDVSQDGAHVVMVGGGNGTSQEEVFSYNFVTKLKGPVYTTQCAADIDSPNNACLHKLIQTSDNNIIIQFANDGTSAEQGNRLWAGSSPLPALQDATNHLDAGEDQNGSPVFIEIGNNSVLPGEPNPCPSGWGTDVRQVYNVLSATCLIDIDKYGSLSNEHVGYRGNPSQPWVGLSFFDSRTPSPEWFDVSSNYTAPSSANWQYLEDEIDLVRIDANNDSRYAYRLAHAYTRSNEDFYATARAAISRDGAYIAFDSNMAYAHTGCLAQAQTSTGCTDVYIIKLH